ncbi:polysaccharide biosynthesis protein [Bacillus songklensis]|uniref:Polysaccharide biosynthesis protein n=1 Tax=Bacillus songklensis TaxID=1069116 RepID=A0ABV8B2R4_9BACI
MNKYKSYIVFILIDTVIILSSVAASHFLLHGTVSNQFAIETLLVFLLFWLTTISFFHTFRLYHRIWRYASTGEIISITKATSLSMFFVYFLQFLWNQTGIDVPIHHSMFPLTWMMIILGVFGSRFLGRIIQENQRKIRMNRKRTLIIGAGNAGVLVARELKNSIDTPLYPVAFVDDDLNKLNMRVWGIPVVGTKKDIISIVRQYQIEIIVVAIPSAPSSEIAEVINICKKTKAAIKILPRIGDIINGKICINMIRDVKVEDLLGRPPIEIDLQEIAGYVTGKIVLITGAGGSIGSEICRQISRFSPHQLLLLGHGENSIYSIEHDLKRQFPQISFKSIIADIQDKKRIDNVFNLWRPHVVFHAAAHKHVPLMENNPAEAVKNNIFGTKNVAECSHRFGVERFVLISTDKAVNPTSVMGTTKRVAEMIIQDLNQKSNTKFTAVRFGNVLGSRGSVIPLFKQQIKAGGPVTVTHPEMTRYFMTIPEAVQLVIQAGALAAGGEIFILDMGQPVRISDLARDLITLSGLEPEKDIKIEYTGIRPGEKLYEEILTSEEGSIASKHQLIYVAKPAKSREVDLPSSLNKLERVILQEESCEIANDIKSLLKQLVPAYQPQSGGCSKSE